MGEEDVVDVVEQAPVEADPAPEAQAVPTDDELEALVASLPGRGGSQARDESGRFTSNENTDEAPASSESEPEDDSAATPDDDELVQARQAILRVGMMEEADLESADPDTILRWAQKAKSIRADRDREFAKLREELSAPATDTKASDTENQEAPPEGSPSLDLDTLLSPFTEELGEDLGGALRKVFEAFQAEVSTAKQEAASAKEQFTEFQQKTLAASVERAEKDARQRLGERFPDVADDDVFSKEVQPIMAALAQASPDKYKSLEDVSALMEAAIRASGLKESPPKSRESSGRKRGGQPVNKKNAADRVETMPDAVREVELMKAIRDGNEKRAKELSWTRT